MLNTPADSKQRTAWLITDGKAGMDMPCLGVAEALGFKPTFKHITLTKPWLWLAPWGPVSPKYAPMRKDSLFHPPWPDLAIATGRLSIPYLRALRKAAGQSTYTVILQDPKTGAKSADLICVPAHDPLRGENVLALPTAPHTYSENKLARLRANPLAVLQALPGPRVALVLGGPNAVYNYDQAALTKLQHSLRSLVKLGVSFMVTPSRRTPQSLISAVKREIQNAPNFFWEGDGDNPYPAMLGIADVLIVTADSVNMVGEACATGRPVYIFEPSGGSRKFRNFHKTLHDFGATRLLPEHVQHLDTWTYDAKALDAASILAQEINRRMALG
ncbi:MAG: mitochondrial fission ELM1 family protein [Pseudomonadota bacterium]